MKRYIKTNNYENFFFNFIEIKNLNLTKKCHQNQKKFQRLSKAMPISETKNAKNHMPSTSTK